MLEPVEIIFGLIFVLILGGILILFFKRFFSSSKHDFAEYEKMIKETKELNPAHGIMESHKIFIEAIGKIFHLENTSAKKINKAVKYFPKSAVDRVWHFHGLRNKVAHQTNIKVSQAQARECRQVFIKSLRALYLK